MIYDVEGVYSDRQVISGTSPVASINRVRNGPSQQATMEPFSLYVVARSAMAGSGGSLVIRFEIADDENFTNPTVIGISPALTQAQLVAGFSYALPLRFHDALSGFSRVTYTLSGIAPEITVSAWVLPTSMVPAPHVYPSAGYSIA